MNRNVKRLTKEFYQDDVVDVSKQLLGKILCVKKDEMMHRYKIVETEAYCGLRDKASHAYLNKRTKRTEIMFDDGGKLYIYLIYGMYYCLNIVVNQKDVPQAVLIRAVEPLDEGDIRYKKDIKTNGPGKLCKHIGIDKTLNGLDLTKSDDLFIVDGKCEDEIISSKRINIDYSEEAKDFYWRFYIKNNRFVSGKKM